MNDGLPRGTSESPTGSKPADAALEIAQFGSAVLRDVWDVADVGRLRDGVAAFCDRRARLVEQGSVDPLMRHYHETGTTVLTWLIYEGLLDLDFLSGMFRGSFYHEVCMAHFEDDRLYLAPERIGSRNIRPPYTAQAPLPFHQDSVEQDPKVTRVLNCWIPLDAGAGQSAPGVEVVRHPGRPKFPLKVGTGSSGQPRYEAVAIDRANIVAEYGENFLAPGFAPGDSLVFSQDVIHRTYITPQMTNPRIGFEFRVFSLKHLASWACPDEIAARSYPLV
jgi:hypothetical protein